MAADPTTIAGALAGATARLAGDSPRLDAEVLLAHCLDRPRSHLAAWPERVLDTATLARFEALVARRARGEPVAHLTGVREFWSLELGVTPATLIPRPDTETLVELALRHIPRDRPWPVADLGTGSGAIALALAAERPLARVVATDRSVAALAVARANRDRLGLANVTLVATHWADALAAGRFRLVACNPPYVAAGDPHLERGDVAHEPRDALAAGPDGLAAMPAVMAAAARCLEDGWLLVEHGADQGPAVRRLMAAAGFAAVRTWPDLAGRDRVTEGRRVDSPT